MSPNREEEYGSVLGSKGDNLQPAALNALPNPQDALNTESSGEQSYRVQLEAFEGPLDLLLHLIKQEKIDIWDIPIATITEQYLAYMKMMEELNLNVAGDFVMMAATLIYIKSKMLLPPDPRKSEDSLIDEDPRKELVYQLLEHQKFKQAAQVLYSKETVESCIWGPPAVEVKEGEEEVVVATLFDLVRAFHKVLSALEDTPSLDVVHEEFTIEQKIDEIRKLLVLHGSIRFSMFVDRRLSRRHLIVVFLAILELTRQAEIYFTQQGLFHDIVIHHSRPRRKDLEAAQEGDLEKDLSTE